MALLVAVLSLAAPAAAQQPAPASPPAAAPRPAAPAAAPRAPREGEVASDPIRCWWKADRTAVRVGERFLVVLTCGVIETGGITVVPNVTQLDPGAVSLTPFDVVSGVRRDDVVAPPWRYIQFEYTVRLVSDGFFGQDLNIPQLNVTYNLQAPGGGSTGRDQTYVLPAMPMRVLSLVPRTADDIRDASSQTFAAVETRRFRAQSATVAAGVAFAFSALFLIVAGVRATGRLRARDATAVRPLPTPSVLAGSLRAISDVRGEAARGGWTPELARRALTPLRVAAAVALGRPVAQQFVGEGVRERDGQLLMKSGLVRRRRVLVSAPTTTFAVDQYLGNGQASPAVPGPANGNGSTPRSRAALEPLAESLRMLSTLSYGRANGHEATEIDAALERGTAAIRKMRMAAYLPKIGHRA